MTDDWETPAEAAFARDVPEELRQDIRERMCNVAHNLSSKDPGITILDRDQIDAINVRVSGIIEIGENDHWFILESGNWRGDVLEAWDDVGTQKFEPLPRTVWTLAPKPELVDQAILAGNGPFLIAKWDALAARPEIARIPGSYSYDRTFQPGHKVETYWTEQAAKHHFVLVSDEHAKEIRKRLLAATEPVPG